MSFNVRTAAAGAWVAGLLALLLAAPGALAHGDGSSHSVETGSLYPSFGDGRPSQPMELRLLGLLDAVKRDGYPIKVVLIGSGDNPDDPAMQRTPQRYARFVQSEIEDGGRMLVQAPLVVVSRFGLGVAGRAMIRDFYGPVTPSRSRQLVRGIEVPAGARGDELAVAAMAAVRRLAAIGGHRLPARVPPLEIAPVAARRAPDDGAGIWLPLGIFMVLFGAAAAAYEGSGWVGRRRRARALAAKHRGPAVALDRMQSTEAPEVHLSSPDQREAALTAPTTGARS